MTSSHVMIQDSMQNPSPNATASHDSEVRMYQRLVKVDVTVYAMEYMLVRPPNA